MVGGPDGKAGDYTGKADLVTSGHRGYFSLYDRKGGGFLTNS
jgi:hypothetical protein